MAETDKALEGLVHVQAAALELIKAGRAFLDVAEDLVQDPATARAVMTALGAVAKSAAHAAQAAQGGGPSSAEEERSPGVERIVVE